MTSPSERVQRLRVETTKAAIDLLTYADRGATLQEHAHRWDPKAAEEVLDLLEGVLKRHARLSAEGVDVCEWCSRDWPCMDHCVALAVLDALDPQEKTP